MHVNGNASECWRLFIYCFKYGVNTLLTSPPSNKVLCSHSQPPPAPTKFTSADGQRRLFAETPLGTREPRVLPGPHSSPSSLGPLSFPLQRWAFLPRGSNISRLCLLPRWGCSAHAPGVRAWVCACACAGPCVLVCTLMCVLRMHACVWGHVSEWWCSESVHFCVLCARVGSVCPCALRAQPPTRAWFLSFRQSSNRITRCFWRFVVPVHGAGFAGAEGHLVALASLEISWRSPAADDALGSPSSPLPSRGEEKRPCPEGAGSCPLGPTLPWIPG